MASRAKPSRGRGRKPPHPPSESSTDEDSQDSQDSQAEQAEQAEQDLQDAQPAPIYMDANATTLMSPATIETMVRWCNRGNPSSEYAAAKEVQRMFAKFRAAVAEALGAPLGESPADYTVVFTSGASESNCAVLVGAARSYRALTGRTPHLVLGATEHKSARACAERLAADGLATVTFVPPALEGPAYGAIEPAAVAAAIAASRDVCLVSVMTANNETGAVTDIAGLARVCAAARVPFHSDAVQAIGKTPLPPLADLQLAALSASAHKFHGPPGVGLLVLRNSLVQGYRLCPHICGSQNGGMRGGTENVPGIAAAFAAFRSAYAGGTPALAARAARIALLRDALWAGLAARLPAFHIAAAATPAARAAQAAAAAGGPPVIFRIGAAARRTLPNTLLVAVSRPGFCNRALRAALESRGIIVGLGSACNGGGAGDGLRALGIPDPLVPGIVRLSLDDEAQAADVATVVAAFVAVAGGPDCLKATK